MALLKKQSPDKSSSRDGAYQTINKVRHILEVFLRGLCIIYLEQSPHGLLESLQVVQK